MEQGLMCQPLTSLHRACVCTCQCESTLKLSPLYDFLPSAKFIIIHYMNIVKFSFISSFLHEYICKI